MEPLSVEEKLKALYRLQVIDSRLDNIRNIRGELPMEVQDLEDTLEGLETRVEKFKAEIANYEESIKQRNAAIKESKNLISKYESQQGNVKNNREYLALSKEVELQKLEIMAAEKKIKEFQSEIEEKTEQLETTMAGLADKKKDLEEKKAELDSIINETEREEGSVDKVREEAAKQVDERLLNAYERIRVNVVNRLAVVTIEREACSGCFSQIPPQRQLDIGQRKKVIACENCGRVIVDNELAEEVKGAIEA